MKTRFLSQRLLAGYLFAIAAMLTFGASASTPAQSLGQSKVREVSVAVHDVAKASKRYAQLLGLKQWQYLDLSLAASEQSTLIRPQLRVARSQWHGVTIELIQPLADDSPVKTFLQTRGAGLFSISVAGDVNLPQQKDLFSARSSQGAYARWLDTYGSLGVNLKVISDSQGHRPWGEVIHKVETPLAPPLFQLGVVVKDVAESAKNFQRLTAIAPWIVVDFKAPHVTDAQYLGAHSDDDNPTFVQVGYGNWSGLQIELLAPKTGPSPHRDFLLTQGAGAHHLSFGPVASHDELVAFYQRHDIDIQMQSDNGGKGRTATYMASEDQLGFVLELTRPFKGMGSLRPSAVIGMPQNQPQLSMKTSASGSAAEGNQPKPQAN